MISSSFLENHTPSALKGPVFILIPVSDCGNVIVSDLFMRFPRGIISVFSMLSLRPEQIVNF